MEPNVVVEHGSAPLNVEALIAAAAKNGGAIHISGSQVQINFANSAEQSNSRSRLKGGNHTTSNILAKAAAGGGNILDGMKKLNELALKQATDPSAVPKRVSITELAQTEEQEMGAGAGAGTNKRARDGNDSCDSESEEEEAIGAAAPAKKKRVHLSKESKREVVVHYLQTPAERPPFVLNCSIEDQCRAAPPVLPVSEISNSGSLSLLTV